MFLFVLKFYGQVNPMGSYRAKSVRCFCFCVEVLQPNGVMSSMVSIPNHTFTGRA